jgi:hypothetical protein
MPAPQQSKPAELKFTPSHQKDTNVDSSSAWAWSSAVLFTTPSTSAHPFLHFSAPDDFTMHIGDNIIRRVSDGAVMVGGHIILAEGYGSSAGSGWSVFTVGDICSQRRAFVFKLGGRIDKVAVGFCFPGSDPGHEDVLMKRFQVNCQLANFFCRCNQFSHFFHVAQLLGPSRSMLFSLQMIILLFLSLSPVVGSNPNSSVSWAVAVVRCYFNHSVGCLPASLCPVLCRHNRGVVGRHKTTVTQPSFHQCREQHTGSGVKIS